MVIQYLLPAESYLRNTTVAIVVQRTPINSPVGCGNRRQLEQPRPVRPRHVRGQGRASVASQHERQRLLNDEALTVSLSSTRKRFHRGGS